MRLNKLRIKNFRNITDTALDAKDASFVVIRGQNRQGKTSLSEALSLALTPTTKGLTAKGDGYVRKIKRGEAKATIEAELQGANRTIKRTVTLSVNSAGRQQSSEDVNDPEFIATKFDKLLDDKKAALGIAINTQAFQSMIYSGDEKAQKNLLAQLVLPARYDFAKDTVADVASVLGEGTINFEGEPFAVIESAYKQLFAQRQDVNRKVKEFMIPDALPRPQGVNSESLKTQLAALREERTKQAGERDTASKQANEAVLQKERLNARIVTLEAVLKASKESLRIIQESILPNPAELQAIADRGPEIVRLVAEQQRLNTLLWAAKQEYSHLLDLSNLGSVCPTCEQEIDDSKLPPLVEASMAKRTRLEGELGEVDKTIKSFPDVTGAIERIGKHKKAEAEKIEAAAKVVSDTATLDAAKAEAGKDFGGLFESATFDDAISKTDKDIETIIQQIQPVIAAEERDKEINVAEEKQAKLEAKAIKLDKLVKLFDKDGIKAKLIAEYIGSFERRINAVLSAWDYSCSLSIEPFKFEVTDYRKVSTPVIDLSGAEELMFYAAFQCAVSQVAGIGFVVIDRVDTLLPDLRPALFKNLYEMVTEGTLEQVILLIADTNDKPGKLEGSQFFMIEEGSLRRLG